MVAFSVRGIDETDAGDVGQPHEVDQDVDDLVFDGRALLIGDSQRHRVQNRYELAGFAVDRCRQKRRWFAMV